MKERNCNECKWEKEIGKCFHKNFEFGTTVHKDKKITLWTDPHYTQEMNKDGNCKLYKSAALFSFLFDKKLAKE